MQKNSDKKNKIGIIGGVIAGVIAFFLMISTMLPMNKLINTTKTYSSNGFTINLPKDFYEKSLASTTAYFESETSIVTALKEEFSTLEVVNIGANSTLDEYAEAVAKNNKITINLKEIKGSDYKYFTYEKTNAGKAFYYMGVVLKSKDSFWLVNFACEKSKKSQFEDKFIEWAKTIKVD